MSRVGQKEKKINYLGKIIKKNRYTSVYRLPPSPTTPLPNEPEVDPIVPPAAPPAAPAPTRVPAPEAGPSAEAGPSSAGHKVRVLGGAGPEDVEFVDLVNEPDADPEPEPRLGPNIVVTRRIPSGAAPVVHQRLIQSRLVNSESK